MPGRFVLGDDPRLVLRGERPPRRPRGRINRLRRTAQILHTGGHEHISSHALRAKPDRRGVSPKPDREGTDRIWTCEPRRATCCGVLQPVVRPAMVRPRFHWLVSRRRPSLDPALNDWFLLPGDPCRSSSPPNGDGAWNHWDRTRMVADGAGFDSAGREHCLSEKQTSRSAVRPIPIHPRRAVGCGNHLLRRCVPSTNGRSRVMGWWSTSTPSSSRRDTTTRSCIRASELRAIRSFRGGVTSSWIRSDRCDRHRDD